MHLRLFAWPVVVLSFVCGCSNPQNPPPLDFGPGSGDGSVATDGPTTTDGPEGLLLRREQIGAQPVAQPGSGIVCDAEERSCVVGEEAPLGHTDRVGHLF